MKYDETYIMKIVKAKLGLQHSWVTQLKNVQGTLYFPILADKIISSELKEIDKQIAELQEKKIALQNAYANVQEFSKSY